METGSSVNVGYTLAGLLNLIAGVNFSYLMFQEWRRDDADSLRFDLYVGGAIFAWWCALGTASELIVPRMVEHGQFLPAGGWNINWFGLALALVAFTTGRRKELRGVHPCARGVRRNDTAQTPPETALEWALVIALTVLWLSPLGAWWMP